MLYPDFNDLVALGDQKIPLKHPSFRTVQSAISGNYRSPFRGQGLEFDSVREYVPGDDIRNIDWRVTARTGSPHLKLFKEEKERHIVLCVDMNATMRFGTRNTFKSVQAAYVAAILGWKAIAQQDRVSACLFGDVPGRMEFFRPNRTRKSFCSLLQSLAQPPSETHHVSLVESVQKVCQAAHTGSLVYVISDFMNLESHFCQEPGVSFLTKKCDVVFIAINDPADKFMYPMGTVGFRSVRGEKILVNTESVAGRKAYAALWDQHQKVLQQVGLKLKIPVLELTTESHLQQELMLGLKTIARRKR